MTVLVSFFYKATIMSKKRQENRPWLRYVLQRRTRSHVPGYFVWWNMECFSDEEKARTALQAAVEDAPIDNVYSHGWRLCEQEAELLERWKTVAWWSPSQSGDSSACENPSKKRKREEWNRYVLQQQRYMDIPDRTLVWRDVDYFSKKEKGREALRESAKDTPADNVHVFGWRLCKQQCEPVEYWRTIDKITT